MKTKTTQTTKIGASTNTRNFFQKTFILLAVLAFTSFGFKAKAQQQFHTDVQFFGSSASGCDWVVEGWVGARLTPEFSTTVLSPLPLTGSAGCQGANGIIDRITLTRGTCVLTFLASAGVFPYTNYLTPCSGTTCAVSINGSGSQSGSGCAADGFIIIQIYY